MKKKLLTMLGLTMIVALVTACGANNTAQTDTTTEVEESTETSEFKTYEFETFDGGKVVINDANIVSQEACDDPLEWADLPADAEQLAPGRDCILFADATNYYVEDVTNKLITVATKDATDAAELVSYEFETFDGITIVINEGTILSQEACEEPLAWAGLPADAEQIAPGRDCILFQDAENFYVEDATNKLVTVAFRELGDVIEDTDIAIFDNGVFTFSYDPENFTVTEAEGSVNVSFTNEEVQTAGTNIVSFTELVDTDAMQQIKNYMEIYEASEDEMVENYLGGDDVKGYSYSTGIIEREDSELRICNTYHAIPCGDNIIFVDKLRTYGDDMDLENSLDAQLDEVILSFHLD